MLPSIVVPAPGAERTAATLCLGHEPRIGIGKLDRIMSRSSVADREIYCHLTGGVADSLLTKGFFEKKPTVPYTGRNWRTVEKLAEL